MKTDPRVPSSQSFGAAALRNRLRLILAAPVAQVWPLLGDMSRLPEYSAGLERVEMKRGATGAPTEFRCHFKAIEKGGPSIAHGNRVVWYEPNLGWASRDEEPNDFGFTNSLHIVTLQATKGGTAVQWEACYDAADLERNRRDMDQALADIGDRLVGRFGGRVVERYTDGTRTGTEADVILAVETMTEAFHRADLDAVLAAYELGAAVAFEPGKPSCGEAALREGFQMFFGLKPRFSYSGHEVLIAGDTALHFAPWTMKATAPDGEPIQQSGLSVALLRRGEDDRWRLVIDNPFGGRLLAGG